MHIRELALRHPEEWINLGKVSKCQVAGWLMASVFASILHDAVNHQQGIAALH